MMENMTNLGEGSNFFAEPPPPPRSHPSGGKRGDTLGIASRGDRGSQGILEGHFSPEGAF